MVTILAVAGSVSTIRPLKPGCWCAAGSTPSRLIAAAVSSISGLISACIMRAYIGDLRGRHTSSVMRHPSPSPPSPSPTRGEGRRTHHASLLQATPAAVGHELGPDFVGRGAGGVDAVPQELLQLRLVLVPKA